MNNSFYTSVAKWGNSILVRGYKDGNAFSKKITYRPTLYVKTKKPTNYTSLFGSPIAPIEFDSMKECDEFIRNQEGVANQELFGQTNYTLAFISDYFGNDVAFNRDIINVTVIDIEVKSDDGFPAPERAIHPVTAITIKNNIDDTFYTWGCGNYDKNETEINGALIEYIKCTNEAELLERFLRHWRKNYPDVVTGWNSTQFDMVYLVNRIRAMLGEDEAKKLSPWGNIKEKKVRAFQKEIQEYDLMGIELLDYLDLFKKFGYSYGNQESYRLDHIGNVVLGEKKLDYSEYGSLHSLYLENYQKFIDYNIKDVQLIDRMEDKMGLITLCMTLSYKAGTNMTTAFGSVVIWDAFIGNELKKQNIIIPPKKDAFKDGAIEGAYVKDPICGVHKWVCSFDLNSLYPHLMMQYNMSPETYIPGQEYVKVDDLLNRKEFDKYDDRNMTARGNFFSKKKQGIFPKIIDDMYAQRKQIKKEMLQNEQELQNKKDALSEQERYAIEKNINRLNNSQMAIKILMNSLYGAVSNKYFRYYSDDMAESITLSGQLAIRWAEREINEYMNKLLKTDKDYVIAIDTDSLYVTFEDLVEHAGLTDVKKTVKMLDKFSQEKIEPLLENCYNELHEYMNTYSQKMVMGREVIADKGVWTGKKHYFLNVHNSEGVDYKEPKIKMMGIEAVKSSTPQNFRELIKQALNIILTKENSDLKKFIEGVRESLVDMPIEDISFPRGISHLNKFVGKSSLYDKGTPIHVRGAILHNHHIEKNGLSNKYNKINDGDKVKFCYLRKPNPIQENVIAFQDFLPPELGLKDYVDYDTQFEKAFLEPINLITKHIGWTINTENTLEDFFT